MTTNTTDDVAEQEPAAPPLDGPPSEMIFGAGQSLWLAMVTLIAVLALAVSFVALVQTSGDDGGGAVTAPTGPATEVEVSGVEFAFDPTDVLIAADTDVAVTFVNDGNVEHNWTVIEAGTTVASETDFDESLAIVQLDTVNAGEDVEGTVNLPAGDYQVICTIAGHLSAGMEGTLRVAS